jgi:1,4-alpha-glucan branching enzyme
MVSGVSKLGDLDLYLVGEGRHEQLYERLGAHVTDQGIAFAVWAPNAREVSVVGDWNGWNRDAHPLTARGSSGIWEGFLSDIGKGALYKYRITAQNGYEV